MAHAMGRTLVLPPEQKFYLLGNDVQKSERSYLTSLHVSFGIGHAHSEGCFDLAAHRPLRGVDTFGFGDFFHLDAIAVEHEGQGTTQRGCIA